MDVFDRGFLLRTESGRSQMHNRKKKILDGTTLSSRIHGAVIHLNFCSGDVLNCIWTKMSLNKKRKISAIGRIRLRIPVEDGKWVDTLHFLTV